MLESAEEFVRLRRSRVPDEYNRAAHDEASVKVWSEVIECYPEMRAWVAHNKAVPIEVLAVLACDPDPDVRYCVAMKRKLSPELFWLLAVDFDETVRSLLAANAKAPLKLLAKLSKDPSPLVSKEAESGAQSKTSV